jgi:S1-C subfamily serine protease
MKKIYASLVGLLLLVGCSPMSTVQIVEEVKPGTVLIINRIDATSGGTGTGFILEDNMIITNDHVIDGKNNKIMIISPTTSKPYEAEVVHTDPISDLAIVRVKDWESFAAEQKPVNLTLGDSDRMTEGSKVVIIGHPAGLHWTVSEGILSAKHRRAGPNPKYMDQVDANLFQGNSGGPIFNERGEVVCVSNMMLSVEGGSYGFCIPSNLVRKVIHDFTTLGEVRWRALNVSIGLTEDGSGVILQSVETGGAAETAGLKEGDKIVSVFTSKNHPNGKKIVKTDELITELGTMNGDEEMIRLAIERNGELIMMNVKTGYRLSKEYTPDKAK